jgi:signal transduction histidine kinase
MAEGSARIMQRTDVIRAEQIRLLYANAPIGVVAQVLNVGLLALVQWPVIPPPVILIWLTYMLALTGLRAVVVWRFQQVAPAPHAMGPWGILFGLGAGLAGLGWGSAGVVLFPSTSMPHQVFLTFVLGGMIAGAVGLLSARLGVFLSFACPTAVPVILHLLAQGDRLTITMGGMAALFMLVSFSTAYKLHNIILSSLNLSRELQETNQQLAAASSHKSAFLANVSHELRTPLTAIKGSVDNMLDGLTGAVNDKQRRYLTRIQANTDRLSRLIHDLLDLARIEAGKSDLQPTRLPVVALTQEVVEHLGPVAAEKHIRLDVAAADASVMAWADREKVTQVLMNLIGNAVKFTPSHGTVAIAIHKSGDEWVQISVTDTGPGIPADEATHIFEKFYQIATEGRQKTTGTGLGLAIAKSLVEMQRGQLWVESEVGRGSTFSFTLPVQQPVSLEVVTHA